MVRSAFKAMALMVLDQCPPRPSPTPTQLVVERSAFQAVASVVLGQCAPPRPSPTPTQLVVERSAFQAVASVAAPFAIIHTTVDVSKKLLSKLKVGGALGR